jgi:hypothetical protein
MRQSIDMKTKLKTTSKRKPAGRTRALAVAPSSASAISDRELNATLHHVMLDKELDDLGAPKEQSGGKLSPFGRLRRIGPQLLADKRRLDWLEKHNATLAATKERWSEEVVLWWQVVDGKHSLSGHPLSSPREAIDAAMRGPNANLPKPTATGRPSNMHSTHGVPGCEWSSCNGYWDTAK